MPEMERTKFRLKIHLLLYTLERITDCKLSSNLHSFHCISSESSVFVRIVVDLISRNCLRWKAAGCTILNPYFAIGCCRCFALVVIILATILDYDSINLEWLSRAISSAWIIKRASLMRINYYAYGKNQTKHFMFWFLWVTSFWCINTGV